PFDFCSALFLSQLQGRQAEQSENSRENPKPDDDSVFLPANQLEMMVNGRHGEDAAASQFETEDLQDHRDRFDDENAAYHNQQQFLLTTNGHYADHATDRERPCVAHENLGRMTIEPQKSKAGADQRRANYRQFSRERIKWDLQIFRDAKISSCVREQRIG